MICYHPRREGSMIMIGKSLTLSRFGNYMLKFFFSDFFVPFFFGQHH
jgi:hypothetical protein